MTCSNIIWKKSLFKLWSFLLPIFSCTYISRYLPTFIIYIIYPCIFLSILAEHEKHHTLQTKICIVLCIIYLSIYISIYLSMHNFYLSIYIFSWTWEAAHPPDQDLYCPVYCPSIPHSRHNVIQYHGLHRYIKVSCLQLIWLIRKWQIVKENFLLFDALFTCKTLLQ